MIGLDLLGLARIDAGMVGNIIEKGTAIGCLLGTFGDPLPKVERLIATAKVPAIRVHLSNACCIRGGNCEWQYELRPNDLKGLAARASKVEVIARRYPGIKVYISPSLEDDQKDPALAKKRLEILKRYAPSCTPVWSVLTGYIPRGVLIEKHGNNPGKCAITSNDGKSLSDASPERYLGTGKLITFAWIHSFNGRGPGDKPPVEFVPPSRRSDKAFADSMDIRYCVEWMKGRQARPATFNVKEVRSPEIYKPLAEYWGEKESPNEKHPVLLVLPEVREFSICTIDGKQIGTAKKTSLGKFGNLSRYYSNLHAPELMQKAGSQWTVWTAGKTSYLINVLYRSGDMREGR